jgi:hypothetical protein
MTVHQTATIRCVAADATQLMLPSRLTELRASVGHVALMGPTYEGIFVQEEQGHA